MANGSLARKLRVLRAERGLGLVEASEMIGVDRHTLRGMERGSTVPRETTLGKVARAYGVPVAELLEEEPALPLGEGPSEAQWRLIDGLGHDFLTLGPGPNRRAAEGMSVPEIEDRIAALGQEREYLLSLRRDGKVGKEIHEVTGGFMEILLELMDVREKKAQNTAASSEKAS